MKLARHIFNTFSQPAFIGRAVLCVTTTAVDQRVLGMT